ncbi:MAG: peroxidase family protein [Dehalococcoidia bacterium]|nr:peroxidase family protein [Dehalococcoidia bacterium]
MTAPRENWTRRDLRIEGGDFAGAVLALNSIADDVSGEREALLGLAHYLQCDYEAAVQNYAAAVERDPSNPAWADMLARSRANAEAEVSVFVPPETYYDRDEILAPPAVPAGALPRRVLRRRRTRFGRARQIAGDALGACITAGVEAAIRVTGRVGGYRDDVWTNWYRKRTFIGVLTLGYMRTLLNKNNLLNTYPKGTRIGFVEPGLEPPRGVTHYRTADGTWNNLDDPKEGAAGTRFPRNARVDAVKPETGARLMTPNPREVSRRLLAREGEMLEVPFLNMLAASWINFQNHDWISHGQSMTRDVHEIPLAEDDPARTRYNQRNLFIGKTQPDPTRRDGSEPYPISFINEVTHWWDGSQIYGSDQQTVDRLRSHVDGKLRVNEDGTLPLDSRGIEDTGFTRNWWIGLAMLHTLFAREHNAICDHLKEAYPDWDDTRLFNVARLINAAVMAKIHSVEWTPAILPNEALADALDANWYGVLTNLLRRGKDKKTVAPINIRNPEMGGVVGNPINKHGEPYGLTEEFVEVYRLHPLLPETLEMRRASTGQEAAEDVPFPAARQAGSGKLTRADGDVGPVLFLREPAPGAARARTTTRSS